MLLHRIPLRALRFGFHLFYNPFAFTYDFVSAFVSRGRWRAWTRAAITRLQGARILEVPCGTGNLLLDLRAAGYAPVGVDLSASMLRITRGKLRGAGVLHLIRARAQALPFPNGAFDSIVMTFPPGFISDPAVVAELRRALDDRGRLIWVDAARFIKPSLWSRFVNPWIGFGGDETAYELQMAHALERAGFDAQIEWVGDDESVVAVAVGTKTGARSSA